MRRRLDALLLRCGFIHPEGRALVRDQIVLAAVTSLAAMALSGFGDWGLAYGGGAFLATANFWWLVRFAQGLLTDASGAVGRAFLGYFARLGVTGAALYVMIVPGGWPVWAILAGMSTVMMTIVVWGALRGPKSSSVKEA